MMLPARIADRLIQQNFDFLIAWLNKRLGDKRIVTGIVSSAGAEEGGDTSWFDVTKNGTGDFTISFSAAFAAVPVVHVTGNSVSSIQVRLAGNPTTTTAQILTANSSGTQADGGFHFTAIGRI